MATKSMDFSSFLNQIASVTSKTTYENKDEGYWRPTVDKAGNAAAVIRFLPSKDIEDIPFVRMFTHGFKNAETGRWYIENSLSTIGGKDYIGAVNQELWNTALEENKAIAKMQKRKLSYISNILVIKDTANPENNGKVFMFRYGMKIFEKMSAAAKPEESLGEEPINVYDPIGGADFILKQKKVAGFPNYDDSRFSSAKELFNGDDKKITEVTDKCYDLSLEVAPNKFKTEEELKSKYLWVMGLAENGKNKPVTKEKKAEQDSDDAEMEALVKMAEEPEKKVVRKTPPPPVMTSADSDDDADFFKSLLND
jgi:hypothetical protein